MDFLPQQPSTTDVKEQASTRADQQLDDVIKVLKEAQKCLRRDWEHLAPRERSAQSRVIKDLEQRKQLLEEVIEMTNGD